MYAGETTRKIIWVFSPATAKGSDGGVRSIPPGVYQQVKGESFCFLTPGDVVFSTVATKWIQLTERTEWVSLTDTPMVWVYWDDKVNPPCVAPVVQPGGYSYEERGENGKFFVLIRQEFVIKAAPVAIATPTRARGYMSRRRGDEAFPFLPRGLRREDVERYFREAWGERVRRVDLSGNTAFIEWSPLYDTSAVIRTQLEFVDGNWVVVNAGFCLYGIDEYVPASILPQLHSSNGSPGRVFLVGE